MKHSMIFVLSLCLVACSKPESAPDSTLENIALPAQQEEKNIPQRVDHENFPNENTRHLSIETALSLGEAPQIQALKVALKKDHFKLEQSQTEQTWSINDCDLNQVVQVQGAGIQSYFATRQVAIGQNKDYFPDFIIWVFHFNTEQEARKYFATLQGAVASAGFCNGKAPEKVVQNGKQIFYLATRAEMFRGYINTYADFIAHHPS